MKKFNEWVKIREGSPDQTLRGPVEPGDPNDPHYQWFLKMKQQAASSPIQKSGSKPVDKPASPITPEIDANPTQMFSADDMIQAYHSETDPQVKQYILRKIRQSHPDFRG